MTIITVAANDTFQLWLSRTNQAISVINQLTDGALFVNGSITFANASFSLALPSLNVANNLVLTGTGNTLFLQSSNVAANGTLFSTGAGVGLSIANNAFIGKNLTISLVTANTLNANNLTIVNTINTSIFLANTANIVNLTTSNLTIGRANVTGNVSITGNAVVAGNLTAVTASIGANNTRVSTTAFATTSVAVETLRAQTIETQLLNDTGRNLIHNGMWRVQQRGVGGFSVSGYTVDRWRMDFVNGSMSVALLSLTDGMRVTIGDENARTYVAVSTVGTSGAGDFAIFSQFIEDVSRISNQQITVSFWAQCAVGTTKLGVGIRQSFGTGGSPSTNVDVAGQSVTLTTTLTRYTLTFTMPSTSGKTLGTTPNTSYTRLAFAFSSGTTNAAIFGTPGVQTNDVVLWGVQLEVGSSATLLEKPDYAVELANCQRFFQYLTNVLVSGYNAAGLTFYTDFTLATTMRSGPTIVLDTTTYFNGSTLLPNVISVQHIRFSVIATATGLAYGQANMSISADL